MGDDDHTLRQCFNQASTNGDTLTKDEIPKFLCLINLTCDHKVISSDQLAFVDTLPKQCQLSYTDAATFIDRLSGSRQWRQWLGAANGKLDSINGGESSTEALESLINKWLNRSPPLKDDRPKPSWDIDIDDINHYNDNNDLDPVDRSLLQQLHDLQTEYVECLEQQRQGHVTDNHQLTTIETAITKLQNQLASHRREQQPNQAGLIPTTTTNTTTTPPPSLPTKVIRLPAKSPWWLLDSRVWMALTAVVVVTLTVLRYAHNVASIGAAMPLWAEVYARLVQPGPEFYRHHRFA